MFKGKSHKFGDDISTDLIAPGRLFHLRTNLPELAKHVLEDADSDFAKKVQAGDFVVGGKNFGLGSSREHAPTIIKLAGVSAVLAKSFARIFYRNAINVGLPVLVCDTDQITAGDELEVNVGEGIIKNLTKGINIKTDTLPKAMLNILEDGGLVAHFQKHDGFKLD
ncbi:MAG: 3-isopropylmalate dehydratase small subunit [Actinomycetota bacterium]|nr:3-isopropylmalate dehydratase small subunit [Actinomycetota bacterium]